MRVVAYCRVSSPSDEQALSLKVQIQYYTEKIESNALWENVGVFSDTATGRNTKRRAEFKKLLAKCHAGKVDLILTKSISRFGRNSLEAIQVLHRLYGLNIEPKEAEVVRLIFDLRLQGKSCGAISDVLLQKRIPSPTGKPVWSRECIRKMLCNEKYVGAVLLQKTYVEDFFTGKQKKNVGQRERYYYKNSHEAIIAPEAFEKMPKFSC